MYWKKNSNAVLCFASGETPKLTYELMVKMILDKKLDLSGCKFIGLDEWVSIPPQNEGSCHYFLHHLIFEPLNIQPSNIHLFNAMSENLDHECKAMDNIILTYGIDLMVVGVGMNGHIGFNEPGVSIDNYCHVINLDEITQSIGQKYFKQPTPLKQGITLGLRHLLESKKAILIANGTKKAKIMKKTLESRISNHTPSSIIRTHHNSMIMIDEEASSLLERN